ncbi:MAG: M48 family metalloprotease [Gammaproteobacteria bacterium]
MLRTIIKTHSAKYKFTLIAALFPLLVFAGASDLPDFADSAGSVISPEYERRLGQMFLKQVRYYSDINRDPEVESYIQSIGYQLVSHSDNTQQPFKFFVVNNPVINAFAGPGGMIGIHTGVILNSDSESELAAVMAHEIAHVTQRHLARMFEQHDKYSVPSAAAMVGAILLAIVNPQAGAAALSGVAGLNLQSQINFTRANEEEADRIGMQLLARSGHDPRAMPAFFEKLQQVSRYSQVNAPEFLRTHPLTTSRIADTMARAESYPREVYDDSLTYQLVKNKLTAYAYKNPADAINELNLRLNNPGLSEKDKLSVRYGLGHAYLRNNDYVQARVQSDILLKADADSSSYMLLAAKIHVEQSNYEQALAIYERAYKLYPDYKPVLVAYSRALLDVKKGEKARELLKEYERFYPHDLNTYALLGQAEAMLGNEIETAIIQADYYFHAGETKLAIDKLKFIQQQYRLDYYQEERVKAKMTELKYELELEKAINI